MFCLWAKENMAIKYFHPLLANIMCVRWNPERPDWI